MNAKQVSGAAMAVLLGSAAALYAQRGGPPEEGRHAGPGMRPGMGAPGQVPLGGPGFHGGMRPAGPTGRPCGLRGGPPPMPSPESLKKAGATEQQVKAAQTLIAEHQEKQIELRAAAEKAQLTLDRLMKDESTDEKAIAKAVDEVTRANGELHKSAVLTRVQMRKILGEEILGKLREQRPPPPPPEDEE